jgi:hypothetical protein
VTSLGKYEKAMKHIQDSCFWQLIGDDNISSLLSELHRNLLEIQRLSEFFQSEKLLPFEGDTLALLLMGSYEKIDHEAEVDNFLKILPPGISVDFLEFCRKNVKQVSLSAKREDGQLKIQVFPPVDIVSPKSINETNSYMKTYQIPILIDFYEHEGEIKIGISGENPMRVKPSDARQILGGNIPPYLKKLESLGVFFSMSFDIKFGFLDERFSHINDIFWLPKNIFGIPLELRLISDLQNTILGGKRFFTFLFGETAEEFRGFFENIIREYKERYSFKNDDTLIAFLKHWIIVESEVSFRRQEDIYKDSIVFPEDKNELKNFAREEFVADIKKDIGTVFEKISLNKNCDEILLLIIRDLREFAEVIDVDIFLVCEKPDASFSFGSSSFRLALGTTKKLSISPFILALKRDFLACLDRAEGTIIHGTEE